MSKVLIPCKLKETNKQRDHLSKLWNSSCIFMTPVSAERVEDVCFIFSCGTLSTCICMIEG